MERKGTLFPVSQVRRVQVALPGVGENRRFVRLGYL